MNATVKSLIFWVVLIVVAVGIWNFSATFERIDAERVAEAQPAAAQGAVVDPEAKLKELGITLPTPGAPIANYVNAVQTGNLLFLAGKGPLPQDGKDVVGRLGKDMTIEQGYQAARSTAIAHLAVLKKELGDLKRVVRIVKVLGMVNSDPAFTYCLPLGRVCLVPVSARGRTAKYLPVTFPCASLSSSLPISVSHTARLFGLRSYQQPPRLSIIQTPVKSPALPVEDGEDETLGTGGLVGREPKGGGGGVCPRACSKGGEPRKIRNKPMLKRLKIIWQVPSCCSTSLSFLRPSHPIRCDFKSWV